MSAHWSEKEGKLQFGISLQGIGSHQAENPFTHYYTIGFRKWSHELLHALNSHGSPIRVESTPNLAACRIGLNICNGHAHSVLRTSPRCYDLGSLEKWGRVCLILEANHRNLTWDPRRTYLEKQNELSLGNMEGGVLLQLACMVRSSTVIHENNRLIYHFIHCGWFCPWLCWSFQGKYQTVLAFQL